MSSSPPDRIRELLADLARRASAVDIDGTPTAVHRVEALSNSGSRIFWVPATGATREDAVNKVYTAAAACRVAVSTGTACFATRKHLT